MCSFGDSPMEQERLRRFLATVASCDSPRAQELHTTLSTRGASSCCLEVSLYGILLPMVGTDIAKEEEASLLVGVTCSTYVGKEPADANSCSFDARGQLPDATTHVAAEASSATSTTTSPAMILMKEDHRDADSSSVSFTISGTTHSENTTLRMSGKSNAASQTTWEAMSPGLFDASCVCDFCGSLCSSIPPSQQLLASGPPSRAPQLDKVDFQCVERTASIDVGNGRDIDAVSSASLSISRWTQSAMPDPMITKASTATQTAIAPCGTAATQTECHSLSSQSAMVELLEENSILLLPECLESSGW